MQTIHHTYTYLFQTGMLIQLAKWLTPGHDHHEQSRVQTTHWTCVVPSHMLASHVFDANVKHYDAVRHGNGACVVTIT